MIKRSILLSILLLASLVRGEARTKDNTVYVVDRWKRYENLSPERKATLGIQARFYLLVEELSKKTGIAVFDPVDGLPQNAKVSDATKKMLDYLKAQPKIEFVYGMPTPNLLDFLDSSGKVESRDDIFRKMILEIDQRRVNVELRVQEPGNFANIINTWKQVQPEKTMEDILKLIQAAIVKQNGKNPVQKEKILFVSSDDRSQKSFLVFNPAITGTLVVMKCAAPFNRTVRDLAELLVKDNISYDEFISRYHCEGKVVAVVDPKKMKAHATRSLEDNRNSSNRSGWNALGVATIPSLGGGGFGLYAHLKGRCQSYRAQILWGAGILTALPIGYSASEFRSAALSGREIEAIHHELDLSLVPEDIEKSAEHVGQNFYHREIRNDRFEKLLLSYW